MKLLPALMASVMGTALTQGFMPNSVMAMSTKPETKSITPQASSVRIQVLETKLGIKIWFVHTPDIPVISANIAFKEAGSKADPHGKAGLTILLGELLQEGVGDLPATAFKKYLLEKNISLDCGGGPDSFNFAFRTVKDNAGLAFDIVKQLLTQARFDKEAEERVKQQTLTELSQATFSENAIASDEFSKQAFQGHPYGVSLKATIEDLPKITVEDIKLYMKERLARDQLVISVAGDIDPEALKEMVDKTFQPLNEKATEIKVPFMEPVSPGATKVVTMEIPQSAILFYQPGISRQDPDFYAAYLLSKIVGDGEFHSRLWNEIREKRGLSYGVGLDLVWQKNTHYIVGHTSTKNQSVQQAIDIIKEQWKLLIDKGVTQEELTFVKTRLMGGYPLGFASTGRIAALMRTYQMDGLDPDFINRRNEMINRVTIDDVNRVAKKLFSPEKLTFIVVGAPKDLAASPTPLEPSIPTQPAKTSSSISQ